MVNTGDNIFFFQLISLMLLQYIILPNYLLRLNSIVPCINLFMDLLISYLLSNYYLNILWFLFKCVIFTYNCSYLCFMCCYSVIMFYCFPMLNVSKFKVCIILRFDAFLHVLLYVFLVRLYHPSIYVAPIL
jgi:hypothetical protein